MAKLIGTIYMQLGGKAYRNALPPNHSAKITYNFG